MQEEEAVQERSEGNEENGRRRVDVVSTLEVLQERHIDKPLRPAATPNAPTHSRVTPQRPIFTPVVVSRTPDEKANGFSRLNVASEHPRKLYNALNDEHCTAFVRSSHFERHWKSAQSASGRLQKIEDQIVAVMRSQQLLELPTVMRNPLGTLKKQLETTIQSRAKAEPASVVKNYR